jgi:hypothetical protein
MFNGLFDQALAGSVLLLVFVMIVKGIGVV